MLLINSTALNTGSFTFTSWLFFTKLFLHVGHGSSTRSCQEPFHMGNKLTCVGCRRQAIAVKASHRCHDFTFLNRVSTVDVSQFGITTTHHHYGTKLFFGTPDVIYHLSIMLYAISSPIPRPQRPVRVRNRTSSTSLAAISPRTLSCTSTRVSSSHFALSCAMRQLRLAYSPKGAVSLGLRRGALRSFPVGFDDPVTPPLRWRIFPH